MNLNRTQWQAVRRAIRNGRKPTAYEMLEALQDLDELFADLEAANSTAIIYSDELRELRRASV